MLLFKDSSDRPYAFEIGTDPELFSGLVAVGSAEFEQLRIKALVGMSPAAPGTALPLGVPRWAGRLALKRHVLEQDALVLLGPDDARPSDNLLARVLVWRDGLQPGEMLDRVDAVLNDAKDWLRDSETVAAVAAVLGLTAEQVDALFVWAAAQRA